MDAAAAPARMMMRIAVVVAVTLPACAALDKIDKASNPPDLAEVVLRERMKEPREPLGHSSPLSPLRATPSAVDFGNVLLTSAGQIDVVISNPATFELVVVRSTVQGCGFSLSSPTGERHVVAAGGQLTLSLAFRPTERRSCSGLLDLEIDSAVGRLTRVRLKGKGI